MKFKRIKQPINRIELVSLLYSGAIIECVNKTHSNYYKLQMGNDCYHCLEGDDKFQLIDNKTIFLHDLNQVDLEYHVVEEMQWYNNIPEHGILCHTVGVDDDRCIEVVLRYVNNDINPFLTYTRRVKDATPLTNEKIKQFIMNE